MRLRLILSFSAVVVVAILSVILVVRFDNENQVQNYLFRGGASGVEGYVTALEQYYAANRSWVGVEVVFSQVHALGGGGMGRRSGSGMGMQQNVRLRLVDLAGKTLVDTTGGTAGVTLAANVYKSGIQLKEPGGDVTAYLLVEGGTSFQRGDELPLLSRLDDAALRAGLIALAIALILGLLLTTSFLRPIRQLTAAARRLAAGDLNHRVEVQGSDELGTLANAFNSMTDSLRASEEHRRAMTADIAHELRSPMAVQRAHLEALQDGIYPLTVENLQPILDQSALLERLVEDLRTLALADAGELRLEKTEVNLVELLDGVMEQFKPAAESRSIRFVFEKQAGLCPHIQADPDRLVQIMNNLLSNAIRHTPAEGEIKISLSCSGQTARVAVTDSGSGIPLEALPHIFDRFYRADHARSRDKGGSGLGLAIARQLAVSHGGKLVAANGESGGAVFTLELPV